MRLTDRLGVSLSSLADAARALSGWRRAGVAFALGALSILSMAPFFLWPVLALTLPGLVWLIDGALTPGPGVLDGGRASWRRSPLARAAAVGWCFGFGYHLFGLFWIGEAFLVEADKFAVLLPFAVTLMPAGLALFWALAAAVSALAWRPGVTRVLALALSLAAAEWLRGHILTGFPWNVLGYALTFPLPLMQAASVLGIYALTLVSVLVLATPVVALAAQPVTWRSPAIWSGPLALAVMFLLGVLRLFASEPPPASDLRVRLVQPSVPQHEKWRPENQDRIFRQHLELSHLTATGVDDGAKGVKLIVWPEAAMPFLPLQYPNALAAVGRMLPDGAHLVSGALRLEEAKVGVAGSRRQVFNSLIVFGEFGRPVATYDKIHLVPFGEYLPLQEALEAIGLEQLSRLRGGFASGPRPRPLLAVPGLPKFGPLICYEAIFPAAIVQGAERPAALINLTNDGWFGNTTGPRQHLHQTRVRAVEEGLPILRSANNGISAIIDAKGRMVARIGMNETGTIETALPSALPPPPYARWGDLAFAASWLAGALVLGLALVRGQS